MMTNEQIAVELTKAYFAGRERGTNTTANVIEIYKQMREAVFDMNSVAV